MTAVRSGGTPRRSWSHSHTTYALYGSWRRYENQSHSESIFRSSAWQGLSLQICSHGRHAEAHCNSQCRTARRPILEGCADSRGIISVRNAYVNVPIEAFRDGSPSPSCRAAVKDARHSAGTACANASRPLLDGREHGGTLDPFGPARNPYSNTNIRRKRLDSRDSRYLPRPRGQLSQPALPQKRRPTPRSLSPPIPSIWAPGSASPPCSMPGARP